MNAQEVPPRPTPASFESSGGWCATSPDNQALQEELGRWARARAALKPPLTALTASTPQLESGVIVMDADENSALLDHPFDLGDASLEFTRRDASSFAVARTPLAFDDSIGALVERYATSGLGYITPYTLRNFAFPFYDSQVTQIFIDELMSISMTSPAPVDCGFQVSSGEAIGAKQMIAPLLQARFIPGSTVVREMYVKDATDSLTITWRMRHDDRTAMDPYREFSGDVQAVLFRNGNIRFSYRNLRNMENGAVIVSSGKESWRGGVQPVAAVNDAADDVAKDVSAEWRPFVDIRSVEVGRVGGTDLLEFRLKLAGPVSLDKLPGAGGACEILLKEKGSNRQDALMLFLDPAKPQFCPPAQPCRKNSREVTFDQGAIVFQIPEDYLSVNTTAATLTAFTWSPTAFADSTAGTVSLGTPTGKFTQELGGATSLVTSLPIVEAFTIPVLNMDPAWETLRTAFNLQDAEVDAVAFHQTFRTDLLYHATAMANVGNPKADGIFRSGTNQRGRYGFAKPKYPTLMHMNVVNVADDAASPYYFHLLSHEFGHHWLYAPDIIEDGQKSRILAPDDAHPAEWVHLPAAFPVYGQQDYSTMGGSNFQQTAADTFKTSESGAGAGYSWNELYLMGLAAKEEVTPWYYIANSNPKLAESYSPRNGMTVRGTRHDVAVEQMVAALGERNPSSRESDKRFRILFVLMQRPGQPATAAQKEQIRGRRNEFLAQFVRATGGRAQVTADLPVAPQAAFSADGKAVAGHAVGFRDESVDYPTAWRWDFGDKSTATERYPSHVFHDPGRYHVTLTVSNSRGSHTASKEIEVSPSSSRRHAVGRF